MKTILIFLISSLFISQVNSQIPNHDFENWTGGLPDNWFVSSGTSFVKPDSNANNGFLGVRLQPFITGTGVGTGTMYTRTATSGSYYPMNVTAQPAAVQFWAITNLLNGDVLTVNTTLKDVNGTIMGVVNATCVSTNSPTYQLHAFQFLYNNPNLPDSGATWFSIKNGACIGTNLVDTGSFAIIDGVELNYTTDVRNNHFENNPLTLSPNPVTNFLNVIYNLNESTNIQVTIRDLHGRKIYMNENFFHMPGTYRIPLDVSKFAHCVYMVSLETDFTIINQKLLINH
jgi:hypothetical protein